MTSRNTQPSEGQWVSGKNQRDRRKAVRRHDDSSESSHGLLKRAIDLVERDNDNGEGHSSSGLRRTDDIRYHGLNNRLHVVETRVEQVVSALVEQRGMAEELMVGVQTNSKDIGELRSEVSTIESNVLSAISIHAEKDLRAMASNARTGFWTLLAVLLTAGITFGAYLIDKLSHMGIL